MDTGELQGRSDPTVHERYVIEVRPAPRWAAPVLAAAAMVVAVVSQAIDSTYGARRVVVTDRRTGNVVGRFREGWLVNEHSPIGIMLTEADLLGADEFEQSWLDSHHNRLRRDPATT